MNNQIILKLINIMLGVFLFIILAVYFAYIGNVYPKKNTENKSTLSNTKSTNLEKTNTENINISIKTKTTNIDKTKTEEKNVSNNIKTISNHSNNSGLVIKNDAKKNINSGESLNKVNNSSYNDSIIVSDKITIKENIPIKSNNSNIEELKKDKQEIIMFCNDLYETVGYNVNKIRKTKFHKLLDMLDTKPDNYFEYNSENIEFLIAVVKAFNTNGTIVTPEERKKINRIRKRIKNVIIESTGLDIDLENHERLSVYIFDPTYIFFLKYINKTGEPNKYYKYYLREDRIDRETVTHK